MLTLSDRLNILFMPLVFFSNITYFFPLVTVFSSPLTVLNHALLATISHIALK